LRKNGLFSEWILSSSGEKSLKMLLHPAPSFLPSSYAPLPQLLWSSNQNPKEKEGISFFITANLSPFLFLPVLIALGCASVE